MACFYIGYDIPIRKITRKLREKTIDVKKHAELGPS